MHGLTEKITCEGKRALSVNVTSLRAELIYHGWRSVLKNIFETDVANPSNFFFWSRVLKSRAWSKQKANWQYAVVIQTILSGIEESSSSCILSDKTSRQRANNHRNQNFKRMVMNFLLKGSKLNGTRCPGSRLVVYSFYDTCKAKKNKWLIFGDKFL